MAAGQYISWHPDEFVQGGLINDVDAEFTNCRFGIGAYANGVTTPAFLTDLKVGDETTEQFWSVGSADDWEASPDGELLTSKGSATSLRRNSNFHFLMDSMKRAGVTIPNGAGAKISLLNGLKAHLIRMPAPKRSGGNFGGSDKINEILVIDSAPGSLKTQPGGKAGAGKAAGAAAGTPVDAETKARELIVASIAKAGGTVKVSIANRDALQALIKTPAVRPAVLAFFKNNEWLGSQTEFVMDGDSLVGA